MKLLLLLTLAVLMSGADKQPQLTWQGEITGGATLFVQGKRVDMEGRSTGAIDRARFKFRNGLPAVEQTVTLTVRQGEGVVEVVEQPTAENRYAAVVDIRNDGTRHTYRLELFWDKTASP